MMEGKKKILIDLERLRYPNSGIANVFKNLVFGLLSFSQVNKLKVSLYGPQEILADLKTGFEIRKRKTIHKLVPFYTYKYHIIHTSHQLSSYFHFKKSGQKKVVTLHDLNFIHEKISKKKYNKELKKVQKNIYNADVIVFISEFVKQDFLENKKLFSFKKEPALKVVYNGILFPDISINYNLGSYRFLASKKYILNIGVLFRKKNQLSLVRMLPHIEEDLVLVISDCNQEYFKIVKEEIKCLSVEHRVHFCHNVSDEEKWALIKYSTCMCHPSTAEGFGIPPIEAMVFGKPVFLSTKTSLPEIGGNMAFYFQNFDSDHMVAVYKNGMKEFYDNETEYQANLIRWSKKFDYKMMAKAYLEIYKDL